MECKQYSTSVVENKELKSTDNKELKSSMRAVTLIFYKDWAL
jgi:hypothetical protein